MFKRNLVKLVQEYTICLSGARVHGSKTQYQPRSQIIGPWLAKIIFFLQRHQPVQHGGFVGSTTQRRGRKNACEQSPRGFSVLACLYYFNSAPNQTHHATQATGAPNVNSGRIEELGPFPSKNGNHQPDEFSRLETSPATGGHADCRQVGRAAQYILQLSQGNTAHFGKKGLIKMKWVRKEKKETSPVVDASLHNPQPECVVSSQRTIFIVNSLTSQNPREMSISSPPPTLQELLLHNQRFKTFAIQRPNRDAPLQKDLGSSALLQLLKCFVVCLYQPLKSIW